MLIHVYSTYVHVYTCVYTTYMNTCAHTHTHTHIPSQTYCRMLGWDNLLSSSTSFSFLTPFIRLFLFNFNTMTWFVGTCSTWECEGMRMGGCEGECVGRWGVEGRV